MSTIFERVARQGHNLEPGDFSAWSNLVGAIPDHEFAAIVTRALEQVGPARYAARFQTGATDPEPLDRLGKTQWAAIADALRIALAAERVTPDEIARGAGPASINPHELTPTDLAILASWTAERYSMAFGKAAAAVRAEPNVIAGLLGPDLLLALGQLLGPAIESDSANSPPGVGSGSGEPAEVTRIVFAPNSPGAGESLASAPIASSEPPPTGHPGDRTDPTPTAETGMTDQKTPGARPGEPGAEALTPPPSPLNLEPPWLTPAHPEGAWPTWAQVQPYFRWRWENRGGIPSGLWEDVESVYEFAYARYRSPEYLGRPFPAIELALRRDWESHGTSAPWDQVRSNVEDAWQILQQSGVAGGEDQGDEEGGREGGRQGDSPRESP